MRSIDTTLWILYYLHRGSWKALNGFDSSRKDTSDDDRDPLAE
jgi:hypothetical protein